jgi:4-diphosphocytidyl-2-C-methyl-D-erythritol kinase
MLTFLAPAKLNLTLEVLARRPDGFHEIRSVIQAINLCDSLRFRLSKKVEFSCTDPNWVSAESLVSKAASLLQETTGCSKGVTIEVDKRIPLVSGLSGDSSDAAAVLRGLNKLWGLGLSLGELLGLASQLGSDVAFFLYGGTAVVRGRGEIVTPLPPFPHMWVVLLLPPVPRLPGKTQRLYTSLKPSHYTRGEITDRLAALLTRGSLKGRSPFKTNTSPSCKELYLHIKERGIEGERLVHNLFNVLDKVAVDSFAGLGEYWQQFLKAGAQEVHLAGSGPALFTLVKDRAQAEKMYHNLQQQGLESYLTETSGAIEPLE